MRTTLHDEATARSFFDAMSDPDVPVGFDTESSGPLLVGLTGKNSMVNMYRASLTGFSVAVPGASWYVPVGHRKDNCPLPLLDRVQRAVSDRRVLWTHNLKHELLAVSQGPIPWQDPLGERPGRKVGCTQILAWLAQAGARKGGPYGLKALAKHHLGLEMASFRDTAGDVDWSQLDPSRPEVLGYACEDAEATLTLAGKLLLMLLPDQEDLYWEQEVAVARVFRVMESAGLGLDRDRLLEVVAELSSRERSLRADWDFLVPDVNPGSSLQLQALYADGTWDPAEVPETTQGHSTEGEYIEWQLSRREPGTLGHEAARVKLEHGKLRKLLSTYGDSLLEKADQYPDGRLHGGLNPTGTATGRPSSSYPNMLNLPAHSAEGKAIRSAICAAPGRTMLSGDYSQIELRILAHLVGSGSMYDGFLSGDTDPHTATARACGSEDRNVGKAVNFATVYGAGAAKVGLMTGMSTEDAQRALRKLQEAEPGINHLRERIIAAARERGYVRTLAGRHRVLPYIRSRNSDLRSADERRAFNTPVQGGARDIMTAAMLRFWRQVDPKRCVPVLQVYDDLLAEADEDYADEAHEILLESLRGAWKLRVPLEVSPARGRRWSEHK